MSENVLNLPDRIYAQYSDKEKLKAWLDIVRTLSDGVATGANQVRQCLDIDKATGESLRIISRIVVVDNAKKEELMNAAVFADPDGTQYGDQENLFAHWSTLTDVDLNDELLRTMCRAKIIKNSSVPTIEDLLRSFDFIFPQAQVVRLINYHDMSFSIEFGGILTSLESWLLEVDDFIPTPQGVRFRGFIRSYGIIEFLNDDSNSPFGDEGLEFIE